ncbi:TonB-dependent receptor [Pedobacter steynii]|uniref:TonB-dependent receptor n=1 Tax=Pedobacter steynii TaxID=430522 RepID=A0A1G9ZK35_9SPHI|nr:TonB-dependent receptor [Pedobacter steynii]NQX40069.1 TonB-dependent receptor [Pedobacter steynii]SDN20883.1 TonB-dependent receptor [Pedobacter steynii]
MYKLYIEFRYDQSSYIRKIANVMKLTVLMICVAIIQVRATGFGQTITLVQKDISLNSVFRVINKQTGYNILWSPSQLTSKKQINANFKSTPLVEVLDKCLANSGLSYTIDNKTIVVSPKLALEGVTKRVVSASVDITITGKVTNGKGEPLEDVSVMLKGAAGKGTKTTKDGSFSINAPKNAVLVFSLIGYQRIEIAIDNRTFIEIKMEENTAQLSEFVVNGISGAQKRSLNIKKASNQFLDAITAEDAGKLPDKNIAEALQRVPGIAIQRNRGEGDFVSIRGLGPQFVAGSINGRTLVSATESFNSTISGGAQSSTGRETNYDVLPSEIIQSIEVYKTGAAEQTEGGIGGVVDIKTAKPLTMGNKYAFSYREQDRIFGSKLGGDFSAIGSWVNKANTLGGLLNVAYSERQIREDKAEGFGYAPEGLFGGRNTFDNNGGGKANVSNVYFPFSSNLESFNEKRKRLSLNGALQWKLDPKTTMSLDFLYSRRNLFSSSTQIIFTAQPFGGYIGSTGTNSDGSVQWPGLQVSPSNTATNYAVNSGGPASVADDQRSLDNIYNTGYHITHNSNGWKLDFDAAYAKADGSMHDRGVVFVTNNPSTPVNVNVNRNYISVIPIHSNAFSVDSLHTRNNGITNRSNRDREYSSKADVEKQIENFFISSIKFGVRYSNREKNISEYNGSVNQTKSDGTGTQISLPASSVPHAQGISNFLNGDFPLNYSNITFPTNIEGIYSKLIQAGAVETNIYNPNQSFDVHEKTMGGYFQANLKGTLGDIPFTGNAGLRVVNTHSDVTSFVQSFTVKFVNGIGIPELTGGTTKINSSSSYTNLLPSINLKFAMSDNTFFRMAYSKSLTRPLFSDLGGLSVNFTNLFVNKYGNAKLKPYKSSNYDIGFEWYTAGGGIVSTNFFYKDLSSFITNETTNNVDFLGVQYRSFSQPQNQAGGNILGNEITFQQPLKFLPGFLQGLGFIANFTFSDGKLNLNNGKPSAFPGISRFSLNSAIYYDNGGKLQARLAYTYRDKYLLMPSDVFGQEIWQNNYGQLDGSISYNIKKGFTIFADAANINNGIDKTFSSSTASPAYDKSRPLAYGMTGVRLAAGVRAVF